MALLRFILLILFFLFLYLLLEPLVFPDADEEWRRYRSQAVQETYGRRPSWVR